MEGTLNLKIMAMPWVKMVGGRSHLNLEADRTISNSLMIQILKIVGMTLSMLLSSLGSLEDDLSKK